MAETKTATLLQLYDEFKQPDFIVSHSHPIEEKGHKLYSLRTITSVPILGKITFGAICFEGMEEAVPVMFLNRVQLKILYDYGIHLRIRKWKHSANNEYVCYPNRETIEKIESM